jgi:hypothetical protein
MAQLVGFDLAACGYFLATVAAHAGDTGELGARSAKTGTIIGSPPYRSTERHAFVLTTASPAAYILRLMLERGTRASCSQIELRFTSTLLPAIVA